MKIIQKVCISESNIVSFIRSHLKEELIIEEILPSSFEISYSVEYTVPEFHMHNLREIVNAYICSYDKCVVLTPEEQDAIEYAISAIKTLVDMGVLSNEEGEK